MPLTTAECAKLLNASAGVTTYTTSTPLLALDTATTAPTATAAGSEVTGGTGPYARQSCPFTSTATGSIANSGTATFAGMPAGQVSYWELWDNAGTSRRWYGSLTTPRTLVAGDSIQFAPGSVILNLV